MPEVLKGWRRKAGCVTLVMACGLMGMWIRSHFVVEMISNAADGDWELKTAAGDVIWSRNSISSNGNSFTPMGVRRGLTWESKPYLAADFRLPNDFVFVTRRQIPGAEYATASQTIQVFVNKMVFTVRYWRVSLLWAAIPLTLLSAYLLLWTPRKRTGSAHA